MLYIKTKIDEHIELKIDLYEDEVFTTCPSCGKEFQLESDDLKQIEDWSSTSISCGKPECNQWMKDECERRNAPAADDSEGFDPNKNYLDDLFDFSIVKVIQKDKQKFYRVFGYSPLGDEVEFGIREKLKEAEELLSFYSQKEPNFQIIEL